MRRGERRALVFCVHFSSRRARARARRNAGEDIMHFSYITRPSYDFYPLPPRALPSSFLISICLISSAFPPRRRRHSQARSSSLPSDAKLHKSGEKLRRHTHASGAGVGAARNQPLGRVLKRWNMRKRNFSLQPESPRRVHSAKSGRHPPQELLSRVARA